MNIKMVFTQACSYLRMALREGVNCQGYLQGEKIQILKLR